MLFQGEQSKAEIKTKTLSQKENVTIKGTVKDEKGKPIPFAAVCDKGTTFGCISAIDGVFELIAPKEIGLHIELTYIDVVLKEDVMALNEAVIVGYGSIRRKDLTGTVASVKSEDIQLIKTQSVENALSGQVAGLNVATTTGKPGEAGKVQIRGINSINGSNQPLYVIDGVPIVVDPAIGGTSNMNAPNPLLTINP